MIINSFRHAFRYLFKNRLFTGVNFIGFLVGFTASFYLASYIYHESTFDSYHTEVENTFRLISTQQNGENGTLQSAKNFLPVAELITDVPEILGVTRVQVDPEVTVSRGEDVFVEKNFVWADENLFDFFNVEFLQGSPDRALTDPSSVVLTAHTARKIFGVENPMGQLITRDSLELKVTGVIKDFPSQTHFSPDMMAALVTHRDLDNPWTHQGYVYLKLSGASTPSVVASKISSGLESKIWWLKDAPTFGLQNMADIHLHSTGILGTPSPVDVKYLYIFGIIGVILVFSTAFNYITLSIADFSVRTKEVAMRKILGAGSKSLVAQPLIECLILSSMAAVSSVFLLFLFMPYLNAVLETRLTADFILAFPNVLVLLSVFGLLFLASGLYPAMAVSRFLPFARLRDSKLPAGNASLRKSLITVQFMIAMILMVSLLVVQRQLEFLGERKLGFDKEQVVVLKTPRFNAVNTAVMKDRLQQVTGVSYVSSAVNTPFDGGVITSSEHEGKAFNLSGFLVDEDYVGTLGMTLLEGRDLVQTDTGRVIVNEAMVRAMGWQEPLGQRTKGLFGGELEVVGVVKDFHLNDVNIPIHPAMISLGDKYSSNLLVRLDTEDLTSTLSRVADVWKQTEPAHPLEITFLDGQFNRLYKAEMQFRELSSIFSGIAIFIACLGIYGFIAYATQQKTKEIGVRKVMGASAMAILGLVSKDFLQLIGVALLVAIPIAWYMAERWLEDFAFRIEVQWWMFALAGVTALVIALLTVGTHVVKAVLANPVDSLRNE